MQFRVVRWIIYGAIALFLAFFVWIQLFGLFGGYNKIWTGIILIIGTGLAFGLLVWGYGRFCRLDGEFFKRNERKILVYFFALFVSLQIFVGIVLSVEPLWDYKAVFEGAKNLAFGGNLGDWEEYFTYSPNTWGNLLMLYLPFKLLSLFGFAYESYAFYLMGTLLNIAVIDTAVFLIYLCAKKHIGIKPAFFSLLLVLLLPSVFLFWSSIFYSDTLSILAPVLAYYLYLKSGEENRGRYAIFAAVGAVAGWGYRIKGTPLFMGLAVVFCLLLGANKKTLWLRLKQSGIVLASLFLTILLLNNIMYFSGAVEREQVAKKSHTASFFIMMGLEGSGGYNPEAFDTMRGIEDPKERESLQRERIWNAVKERKITGLAELFTEKGVRAWCDGTMGVYSFLDDNPRYPGGLLHEILLPEGRYYPYSTVILRCIHLPIMLLFAFGVVFCIKNKRNLDLPMIFFVIGVFAFFLINELNTARSIMNAIPILLILAVTGLSGLDDFFSNTPKTT